MNRFDDLPIERLQQAFDRLPPKLRQPLYLVRVEALSYDATAARLGISVAEVERRIARALTLLDRDLDHMKWHQWRRW